jgi:hypothetical protein
MIRTEAMRKKSQLWNIIGSIAALTIELRKPGNGKQAENGTAEQGRKSSFGGHNRRKLMGLLLV